MRDIQHKTQRSPPSGWSSLSNSVWPGNHNLTYTSSLRPVDWSKGVEASGFEIQVLGSGSKASIMASECMVAYLCFS